MEKNRGSLTLLDALRMELKGQAEGADVGTVVTNGTWLASLLQNLRTPKKSGLQWCLRLFMRRYAHTKRTVLPGLII